MSCELITGSPGAGKTTYAVATRIVDEAARSITLEGGEVVKRRIVCAGVRGLVLDHERLPHMLTGDKSPQSVIDRWNELEQSGEPVHSRLPGADPVPCEAMVQNWWLWCKPGDFIVVDEIQFLAPRGMMGRKPPFWIQALEIHRHYGVDFLFITQHPGLVDAVIKALVNPHRHVRSVLGSSLCTVYTWDHAANPERFQMANKSMFVRRAAHYKLFHSTVAVVAPPTAGRSILLVLPLLLALCIGGVMFLKQAFKPPAAQALAQAPGTDLGLSSLAAPAVASGGNVHPAVGPGPATSKRSPRTGWRASHPVVTGCVARGDVCRCVGDDGRPVQLDLPSCKTAAAGFEGLVVWEPREHPSPPEPVSLPVAPHSASAHPLPAL